MKVRFGFSPEPKSHSKPLVKQVHGRTILEVKGAEHVERLKGEPPFADGVWTRATGLSLHVYSADCLPVILVGTTGVAAIHAGWRGVKQGIIHEGISILEQNGQGSLKVILGPCIGACCFEVKEDFVRDFSAARGAIEPYLATRAGKTTFDLIRFVLERECRNIPPERFDTTQNRCTVCSRPSLPSFRRSKGTDPHIRAWVEVS